MTRLALARCLRTITSLPRRSHLAPACIVVLSQSSRAHSSSKQTSSSDSSATDSPQLSTSSTSSPPISFIERAKRDGPFSLVGPFHSSGGFDSVLHAMTVERMDPTGHAICLLPLSSAFHNSHHKLHGGVHTLLVDVVGTLALLAKDGSRGGVSVDIQCQYMESVELTDTLRCEGRVLKLGKRLGFTEVMLYRQSDGKLVAAGKHVKAM